MNCGQYRSKCLLILKQRYMMTFTSQTVSTDAIALSTQSGAKRCFFRYRSQESFLIDVNEDL